MNLGSILQIRRGIALNALALGTTIFLVAAGAFACGRAVDGGGTSGSAGPPSSVQPSLSPSTSAACTSAQLRAMAAMEGAAGSREGTIALTNLSDGTCTLQGTPTITLLDQDLEPIASGVTFGTSPAGWAVNGSPQPPGWPVVTLEPGESASVRIRWSNWCPDGRHPPLWRIEVPAGGTVDVTGMEGSTPPPCNGPGQASTIEVGPFEPAGA